MRVYLRNSTTPFAIVDSAKALYDSLTYTKYYFSNVSNGTNYYIHLKHRNSIETWSSTAKSFTNDTLTYNFTTSSSQAYGNNMKLISGKYCLYGGDVDYSGIINLTDIIKIYNDAGSFLTGYIISDLNGDHFANLTDILICYNNSNAFVSKITP